MAKRPVFIPFQKGFPFIEEINFEFEWFPGHSKMQAQKSIESLHNAAKKYGIFPVLEISSKSKDPLSVSLSAFNLKLYTPEKKLISVECAFQGSKIFENGGPFNDLYYLKSKDAKTDIRIKNYGKLVSYQFFKQKFPINPITFFYDWLYIRALFENKDLAEKLLNYKGFTDIAFNPKRSRNCQARSAALFVSLYENRYIEKIKQDKNILFNILKNIEQPLICHHVKV